MALRLYIFFFLICIVGTGLGGAYLYYKDSQATIATLRENNAKLEVANETNQATINQLAKDAEETQVRIDALNVTLQSAEVYKDELIAKLQKHDLSRLSLQKPGLIESRINNGTKAIFDELEALSTPSRNRPSD